MPGVAFHGRDLSVCAAADSLTLRSTPLPLLPVVRLVLHRRVKSFFPLPTLENDMPQGALVRLVLGGLLRLLYLGEGVLKTKGPDNAISPSRGSKHLNAGITIAPRFFSHPILAL